jgi:hypothetical protein
MSGVPSGETFSRQADVDLRTRQFEFVIVAAADGEIALPAAAGNHSAGVLQNAPDIAQTAVVKPFGFTKVKLGATLSAGARIQTGGTGNSRAVAATTAGFEMGYILEAGVDGDIVPAVLTHAGIQGT